MLENSSVVSNMTCVTLCGRQDAKKVLSRGSKGFHIKPVTRGCSAELLRRKNDDNLNPKTRAVILHANHHYHKHKREGEDRKAKPGNQVGGTHLFPTSNYWGWDKRREGAKLLKQL